RSAWLAECAAENRRAVDAVARVLADSEPTTGLHVAAAVAGAVGSGRQLFLGASNPIRDVALAGTIGDGVRVLSNRGVAGIDGTNSTAIGAALAGGPTVALMGDLTFIHDTTGLIIGPTEPRPDDLRIVVANDDGGGIFGLLEQGDPRYSRGDYAGAHERIFGTPHHTDLAALCTGVRVPHCRVAVDELPAVLAEPSAGLQVVEVPTDRTRLREVHEAIAAELYR
ncbi:MAG: 2-succinyl-5-enolpyruvyl-6-hydroxy-3-cyclohexene-1-carboxylic-acid synthase, partial [Gordonia sp. (in: high G+C Gram-positive bacteria)]